jgi:hypothetical protein
MLYIYSKAKRRTNMNDVENKTMKNGRLIKYVDLLDRGSIAGQRFSCMSLPRGHFDVASSICSTSSFVSGICVSLWISCGVPKLRFVQAQPERGDRVFGLQRVREGGGVIKGDLLPRWTTTRFYG